MKLERRSVYWEKFRCELTKELDDFAGISKKHSYNVFYHYILADEWCRNERRLAIRVPGGTVGCVYLNESNVITQIVIDINYVVKTYPADINELIQKFVGEVIEF